MFVYLCAKHHDIPGRNSRKGSYSYSRKKFQEGDTFIFQQEIPEGVTIFQVEIPGRVAVIFQEEIPGRVAIIFQEEIPARAAVIF